MWSGPRNLSTAMMYAFGVRQDCAVWDEPLYAHYLARTGLAHPMADKIIAAGETDLDKVKARCLGPVPDGRALFYQKHMTHHLQAEADHRWIAELTNVFLIRHPARVIASYQKKHILPDQADIGFAQQAMLFDQICQINGQAPLVIDSADIRNNPAGMLAALCAGIGISYDPAMLNWPAGGHTSDGVWAAHWYGAVWRSTGFSGAEGALPELLPKAQPVLTESLKYYRQLAQHKLTA